MYKEFGISEEIEDLAKECEKEIEEELIDDIRNAFCWNNWLWLQ